MYGKLSKWIKVLKKTCDSLTLIFGGGHYLQLTVMVNFNVTHGAWFNTGDLGWLRCE